jgi:predicted nucleotidyltransferase
MLNRIEILSFLEENKHFLQSEFHITTIGLVGSFARNEQKEDSDIDFVVDFEPETKHLFDIYEKMKAFFEKAFKKNIDIGTIKYLKPYYKNVILKDAIFI